MKLILENWNKFINEEEDRFKDRAAKPTKVGIPPDEIKKQRRVLKDLISKDYVEFVGQLQKQIKDPKFREFINMGIEDGDMVDDVITTQEVDIPVQALKPTQSQIGLVDSLGWTAKNKPKAAGQTAQADVADVGGRIITANGEYIVDGHHRWSQVYLLNPDAKIPAVNFQMADAKNAKDVLKLTQLAIAAVDRVLPLIPADAKTDIFATGGNEQRIKEILNGVVNDIMAQSLAQAYGVDSKEAVIDKITQNALALYKKGTHNPDVPRQYMPQLDKVSSPSKKVDKLGAGDVNWNNKDAME
tara:strand:+ start:89 stop:988 length:900 start_codon:yes stop_codon:yes gene_type:complete